MIPDTLPCLIYVVIAFALGAWADRVFRPARNVVDHRSDEERRPDGLVIVNKSTGNILWSSAREPSVIGREIARGYEDRPVFVGSSVQPPDQP